MADSTHDTDSGQVAADLRAAADVLERDGWTQGVYVDASGCRCALGAMVAVCGGTYGESTVPDDNQIRLRLVMSEFGKSIGSRWDIDPWNDEPGRTADEVIAALRTAADRAEAQS